MQICSMQLKSMQHIRNKSFSPQRTQRKNNKFFARSASVLSVSSVVKKFLSLILEAEAELGAGTLVEVMVADFGVVGNCNVDCIICKIASK